MHLGISNPKKISLRRANFMLAALNNRRACTCMHFEPAAFGGGFSSFPPLFPKKTRAKVLFPKFFGSTPPPPGGVG